MTICSLEKGFTLRIIRGEKSNYLRKHNRDQNDGRRDKKQEEEKTREGEDRTDIWGDGGQSVLCWPSSQNGGGSISRTRDPHNFLRRLNEPG